MAGPILSGCLRRNRGRRYRRSGRRLRRGGPRRRGWRRSAATPGCLRRRRRIRRTGCRIRRRGQVSPLRPAGCVAKTLPHAGDDEGVLHARRQLGNCLEGLPPVDHIQKSEHIQPLAPAFRLHRPEGFHIHPADAIERRRIHRVPPHHRLAGLNAVHRPDVGRRRRTCALRLDFPPPPPAPGDRVRLNPTTAARTAATPNARTIAFIIAIVAVPPCLAKLPPW